MKRSDYKARIVGCIGIGEEVTSDEISERIEVSKNYILTDLCTLASEGRLVRVKSGKRGSYVYSLPSIAPWEDWPAWTLMNGELQCKRTS